MIDLLAPVFVALGLRWVAARGRARSILRIAGRPLCAQADRNAPGHLHRNGASRSLRPLHTVQPLAQMLGLVVRDEFTDEYVTRLIVAAEA